jgi:hypothetical protein
MNKTIKALNKQLTGLQGDRDKIETKLQLAWNKVFDKSKTLKAGISAVESSNEYFGDECGEIVSWVRFDLSNFQECKQYLECYLGDYCVDIDWDNDCLKYRQGESLIIQDDTRRDNGVWLNHKCIIDESEYRDINSENEHYERGEVNEVKRNELIEKYMEKSGYYPGVFRVDYHGNVSAVKTN